MIFKITQLEPDGIVVDKKTVDIENIDKQIFHFEITNDDKDKHPVFYSMPIKGRIKPIVGERGENHLNLHELVTHFTLSSNFDNEVLTNGRRLVVYRTSEFLSQEALKEIEDGCLGREYVIEKTEDKFKIIIKL